jgi:hypothetical protein
VTQSAPRLNGSCPTARRDWDGHTVRIELERIDDLGTGPSVAMLKA